MKTLQTITQEEFEKKLRKTTDMSNLDISDCSFDEIGILRYYDFSNSILPILMTAQEYQNCNFSNCDFSKLDFRKTFLYNCDIEGIKVNDAPFSYIDQKIFNIENKSSMVCVPSYVEDEIHENMPRVYFNYDDHFISARVFMPKNSARCEYKLSLIFDTNYSFPDGEKIWKDCLYEMHSQDTKKVLGNLAFKKGLEIYLGTENPIELRFQRQIVK